MGKSRRPRSPRPDVAPNQPFNRDPHTETALPAEVVDASGIALPPEPPVEAEPAPAFEAALAAATEAPAHDAPPATRLHAEAAAEPAPEAPPVHDEAATEEPTLQEAIPTAPPETVADEPAVAEAPVQEPPASEPAVQQTAETAVADRPAAVEAAPEPEPVALQPVAPESVPTLPDLVASVAAFAPKAKAEFRFVFMPEPPDFSGIYAAIARYMRGESEAAAAHMRALGEARSPADVIRLQVGELQRAADASLTCWSTVAHKAGYGFTHR